MGTPLSEVTFVVVDLETTGGAPGAKAITEIGALRVKGGEVLGELGTLVNPGAPIPAQITLLTGITNAMVATAPPPRIALSTFLEWARLHEESTVLVAHNARFDVSHLKAAAQAFQLDWPAPRVLDTLALSRRAWNRTEVPNHKLSTLATFVGASTSPTHRALDDARATVDVLHAALEVLASLGLTHMEDLATAQDQVPAELRAKTRLADGLPSTPGVYLFLSPADQVLYVGSAVDLRRRVRSYFNAAETRAHVRRMLKIANHVRVIECATLIEARIRELRLIEELDPPANRRSRAPKRRPWMCLVTHPHPRLSLSTVPDTRACHEVIGPFSSRSSGAAAVRAAESVLRLESWDGANTSLPAPGQKASSPPELTAAQRLSQARRALSNEPDLVAMPLLERIRELATAERYEEAGLWTARLRSFLRAAERAQRVRPLLACPHLIAGRRRDVGGWELVCVRWGRLAGSATSPPGADPRPIVEALRATAQVVERPERIGGTTSVEETLLLADWVLSEGARLVEVDPPDDDPAVLSSPVAGAARHQDVLRSDR
ncbi:DNA polymerase III polC-type [Actinomyces bovis]|uniref:DNA polymerase III polC-type n=1 Tax=Actinomyces bovis TaxID=1658 RepID=A0ABY1VK21_9ACTO|nr:DNA polymerase III polC-type [Actinomyces bovis]VEG54123.1 DNA polymerase III polC-type [Actinomyces israelii]